MFQEILLGLQKPYNQVRSGRPKTVDSEIMLQGIEANQVSSTWGVSGKLSIPQSSVVTYIHNLEHPELLNCVKKLTKKHYILQYVISQFEA